MKKILLIVSRSLKYLCLTIQRCKDYNCTCPALKSSLNMMTVDNENERVSEQLKDSRILTLSGFQKFAVNIMLVDNENEQLS